MNEQLDPVRSAALLSEAASSVFADMAFIDAEPLPSPGEVPAAAAGSGTSGVSPGDTTCAAIDVLSPLSCRIELRFTESLRNRIVDILFSESPEQEKKKNAEDSILEMLNVIAGTFLASYFGAGTEVQLALPRCLFPEEELPGTAVAELRLDAEGCPFELSLYSVRYRY